MKKFLVHPETKMRCKVELTPLGDQIKYRLFGRVYCSRHKGELMNSATHYKYHYIWLNVFGTKDAINKFLKRNKKITKVVTINTLGYDLCDSII